MMNDFFKSLSFLFIVFVLTSFVSVEASYKCDEEGQEDGGLIKCECEDAYCFGRKSVILTSVKNGKGRSSKGWQFRCAGENIKEKVSGSRYKPNLYGFSANGGEWDGFCNTKTGWEPLYNGKDYSGNPVAFFKDFWAHTEVGDKIPMYNGWVERKQMKNTSLTGYSAIRFSSATYNSKSGSRAHFFELSPLFHLYHGNFVNRPALTEALIAQYGETPSGSKLPVIPSKYLTKSSNNFKIDSSRMVYYLSNNEKFNKEFISLIYDRKTDAIIFSKSNGYKIKVTVQPGVRIIKKGSAEMRESYFDPSQHSVPAIWASHFTLLANDWFKRYPDLKIPPTPPSWRGIADGSTSSAHRYGSALYFCNNISTSDNCYIRDNGELGCGIGNSKGSLNENLRNSDIKFSYDLFCKDIPVVNSCDATGAFNIGKMSPAVFSAGGSSCSVYYVPVSASDTDCSDIQMYPTNISKNKTPIADKPECVSKVTISSCNSSKGAGKKFCYNIDKFLYTDKYNSNCSASSQSGSKCTDSEKEYYVEQVQSLSEVDTSSGNNEDTSSGNDGDTSVEDTEIICKSSTSCLTEKEIGGETHWCRNMNGSGYKWVTRQYCTSARDGETASCGGNNMTCDSSIPKWVSSCGSHLKDGDKQTNYRYNVVEVTAPEKCSDHRKTQVRTCLDGSMTSWTSIPSSYKYNTCTVIQAGAEEHKWVASGTYDSFSKMKSAAGGSSSPWNCSGQSSDKTEVPSIEGNSCKKTEAGKYCMVNRDLGNYKWKYYLYKCE